MESEFFLSSADLTENEVSPLVGVVGCCNGCSMMTVALDSRLVLHVDDDITVKWFLSRVAEMSGRSRETRVQCDDLGLSSENGIILYSARAQYGPQEMDRN